MTKPQNKMNSTDLEVENCALRSALLKLANAFKIFSPDADGDIWISLHAQSTGQQAGLNLGPCGVARDVLLEVEETRRAVLAQATGSQQP